LHDPLSKQKQIFNSLYFKYIIYLLTALSYSYFSGLSAGDDGLRHLAFAANKDIMHSWGEVFPHSLFFTEYDPWYIWHNILTFYINIFSYTYAHIAINVTVLFTFMFLLDALINKYSSFKNSSLLIFIVLIITFLASHRYIIIRPDLLSGLFLMSALVFQRNFLALFIITIFYSSSYYLFFLYTGSIGLLYLVLRDYKAFTTVFSASVLGLVFHLLHGGEEFIQTIIYLLSDQSLREGLEVSEGAPLFAFLKIFNYYILVFGVWIISFSIIIKNYDYFKKQHIALLLLIMSPLWLAQVRYFLLLEPLFFLYLIIEYRAILNAIFARHILYYFYSSLKILKNAQYKTSFLLPALLYTLVMFGYLMKDSKQEQTLQQKAYYTNDIFKNQTILLNALSSDIYYALYLNPTIKFVPSCSIGWFEKNEKMKKIYINMMKESGITEEELRELLTYVNAKYYIHQTRNLQQTLSFEKLKKLNILPFMILDNKIIFENSSHVQ